MVHRLILQFPGRLGRGLVQAWMLASLLTLLMIGHRSSLGSQLLFRYVQLRWFLHTKVQRGHKEKLCYTMSIYGAMSAKFSPF